MIKINGNLFRMELRRNAVSLILWMTVIILLISVTMSVYGTFVKNQSQVIGMMSLIPKGALEFKGISNVTGLFSVLGYYAANNTIYMMLLGSIFAMVLGSNILLKEEYNKTAEFLMSRPITRSEIFFSKLAVLSINVFLLNLVTSIAGLISMEIVKTGPFSIKSFLILSFYTFLLNALFGALGLFLSTLVKRAKAITTFTIALVLVFYFIHTLSKITESVAKLGYLSPFKYVNVEAFKASYSLDPWHLVYFLGISLVLSVLAFRIYRRKDIYT
jgi:ABC-2 type transport system permease protein